MQRSSPSSFKQHSALSRQNQSVQGEHPVAPNSSQRSLSIAQQPQSLKNHHQAASSRSPLDDATNFSRSPETTRPNSRANNTIDALQGEVANLKRSLENDMRSRLDVPFFSVASKLSPIQNLTIKSRRLLKGPNGKVLNLDWSQDKRHLVSSTQDGKLLVWDAFPNNAKAEHIISLPNTWVMTCSYAPSGNFIAGGGLDNKITAYPLYSDDDLGQSATYAQGHSSGNYIGSGSGSGGAGASGGGCGPMVGSGGSGLVSGISGLTRSPETTRPNSRANNTIDALQGEVANLKRSLENDMRSRLDVPFFSVASKLSPIQNLTIKSRRLLKGPNGKVLNLDWSQDKRHLVSSTQDGKLLVWDAFPNNAKAEHIISLPNTWVMTCSYAPSGNFIAGGGLDNKITAYPLYSDDDLGQSATYAQGHSSGNYIGSGSGSGGAGASGGGCGPMVGSGGSGLVSGISGLSGSGQSLSSGGLANQANSGSLGLGGSNSPNTIGFHTTGIGLGSGQLGSSQSIKKRPIGTHTAYTSCSQFLGSDQQILTGSGDSTCALWNVECGTIIQSFHGHSADVLSLDVSPSETGNTFVSVGCDKRALIWDTRIGHCGQNQYIQSFRAHIADINSVKFYPSGDSIVTGSDDTTCRLYDLRADQEVAVYEKDSILFGINSVDLSISGRILFAGSNDYTIHVWDALRCTRVCILYGHENRVTCVRVSADGTALASSSWDHSIRIWA